MVSVPGRRGRAGRALEGLQSAAGFLRVARGAGAVDPDRARAPLRARPGPRSTPPGSTSCSTEHPARGDATDRRGAAWTSRRGSPRTTSCSASGGCSGPGPWATPARSIRSPPGCWWCWSGGRPGWRGSSRRQAKTYLATARLGVATDTDDLTGAPLGRAGRSAAARPRRACARRWPGFAGEQRQRPPRYSAKHVDGERSYRLARRGRGGRARRDAR